MNQKINELDELVKKYDELYQEVLEYDNNRTVKTNKTQYWLGKPHPKLEELDKLKSKINALKGDKHNERKDREVAE